MLDYLWAAMVILGIVWGLLQGKGEELTQAVLNGGKDAVTLSLTMLGVMAVWNGLLEIGDKAGLLRRINRLLAPVIAWLFPGLPKGHPAAEAISANFAANLLGLGSAATPAALRAMKELQKVHAKGADEYTASDEMCTFLIINISSLQLIPVNMIAYRSQYGSVNPAAIVAPALIATCVSTLVGVVFCKLAGRRQYSGKNNRDEPGADI